jgi:hypothetical protein
LAIQALAFVDFGTVVDWRSGVPGIGSFLFAATRGAVAFADAWCRRYARNRIRGIISNAPGRLAPGKSFSGVG